MNTVSHDLTILKINRASEKPRILHKTFCKLNARPQLWYYRKIFCKSGPWVLG